jgi:predicted sugar kinase
MHAELLMQQLLLWWRQRLLEQIRFALAAAPAGEVCVGYACPFHCGAGSHCLLAVSLGRVIIQNYKHVLPATDMQPC